MNPLVVVAAIAAVALAWVWTIWRSYWKGWDDADRAADARLGRLLKSGLPDPPARSRPWRLVPRRAPEREGGPS